ncbi:MAG: GAF domain-containing protein, partial [Solirubrobacterales bacterium]
MTNHFSTVLRDLRFGGRSGRIRRPAGEVRGSEEGWILLALGLATLFAIIDGAASGQFVVIGLLALPPILTSATAGSRATLLVAGYCVSLALMAVFWHEWTLSSYLPRVLVVTSAGALSVWNASLRERLTASVRGGALLAEGMSMLDNTLHEQALLDELVKVPVPDLADLAVVDLIADDDTIGAAAVAANDPETTRKIKQARFSRRLAPGAQHPVAEVIRSGERRLFDHMGDPAMREIAIDEKHLELVRHTRPRSVLIVPLRAHGTTIGALMLASFVDDDRFGADEIAFAEELAHRTAAGVMNARLHDAQAHLADALQQALLPRALPAVEGLEIASRFRPVGVGAQIG